MRAAALYRHAFAIGIAAAPAMPLRAQASHQSDEQAIRAQETRWREVMAKGDTVAIRSFYTANGIYAPQDRPVARGRDSVAHMWATGEFTLPKASLERTPTRIDVARSGEVATEIGTWVFRAERGGKPTEYHGNYMFAWRKEDGQWKASAYMWNRQASLSPIQTSEGDTIGVLLHHVLRANKARYEDWMTHVWWPAVQKATAHIPSYARAIGARRRFVPPGTDAEDTLTYVFIYPYSPDSAAVATKRSGVGSALEMSGMPAAQIDSQVKIFNSLGVKSESYDVVQQEYK